MNDEIKVETSTVYPSEQQSRPIVFTGPTISKTQVLAVMPEAVVRGPIARDELYRERERGGLIFLVIDGIFLHNLALPVREVVDVLRDGALLVGCSSMGALRAAECCPVGMAGIGLIYRLYRSGVLHSDDEVAVATDVDRDYRAVSTSLVNIRYALSKAVRAGLVSVEKATNLIEASCRLHFSERHWPLILKEAGTLSQQKELELFCRRIDLKQKDALQALGTVRELARNRPAVGKLYVRHSSTPFLRPSRYGGHDKLLGCSRETNERDLTKWLLGSGRYQRYMWPILANGLSFHAADAAVSRQPEVARERVREALEHALADFDVLAQRMRKELDLLEEWEPELLRWYAVQTMAAAAKEQGFVAPTLERNRVREEVAIMHGLRCWRILQLFVSNGRLFGSIPIDWIEKSCDEIALARSFSEEVNQPIHDNTNQQSGD